MRECATSCQFKSRAAVWTCLRRLGMRKRLSVQFAQSAVISRRGLLGLAILVLFVLSYAFSRDRPRREEKEEEPVYAPDPSKLVPRIDQRMTSNIIDGGTLVIYTYFEKNELYVENLSVFLALGVQQRDDVDYMFVVQGNSTVKFPEWPNVGVVFKENSCVDFGGWRYGLNATDWRSGKYRYFIFINTSIRGPFVPTYVPPSMHWTQIFTQQLQEHTPGQDVGPIKLAGMTISCNSELPHVQSMIWTVDREALQFLVDETEVLTCMGTAQEAIDKGEVNMSTIFLSRGWNIASLSVAYRGWDFRVNKTCNAGLDPNRDPDYFGITPSIHETLFIKTNRGFRSKDVDVYTKIAMQQHRESKFDGIYEKPENEDQLQESIWDFMQSWLT